MTKANTAAQRYGMPPVSKCPQALGKHRQSPSPAQLAGPWQVETAYPFPVEMVPAAVVGGRIWVAGGLTGPEQSTKKTEFYDPTLHTWGPGPPLPIALSHAMMVGYQHTAWVIGGFVQRGSNATAGDSARVLILNKNQDGWINGPSLRHARAAGGAAVVGNKIVVVGGRTGDPGKLVTTTEIYDGTSWHDSTRSRFREITWRPRPMGPSCMPSAGPS